jgi:hypothetical protein
MVHPVLQPDVHVAGRRICRQGERLDAAGHAGRDAQEGDLVLFPSFLAHRRCPTAVNATGSSSRSMRRFARPEERPAANYAGVWGGRAALTPRSDESGADNHSRRHRARRLGFAADATRCACLLRRGARRRRGMTHPFMTAVRTNSPIAVSPRCAIVSLYGAGLESGRTHPGLPRPRCAQRSQKHRVSAGLPLSRAANPSGAA